MNALIAFLILLPLLGFAVVTLMQESKERALFRSLYYISLSHFLIAVATAVVWIVSKGEPFHIREVTLYSHGDYNFSLEFIYDEITLVFSVLTGFLFLVVTKYSGSYLHREPGFRRFFRLLALFIFAVEGIVLSGNFETLFVGWEFLGITSFLLIAFYSKRYLPIRNGMKVYSLYRFADIGILLAMWLSHHLWHQNVTFFQLNDHDLVHAQLQGHHVVGWVISVLILFAGAIKAAQFPFSSWLPRAMEGPTPSSAIFYGSLAVHMGAFLLLRTQSFWSDLPGMSWLIVLLGAVTAMTATVSSRSQPSIKGQIAYSSAAQLGLIFIEIGLGLNWLALVHITGNALFRTYQLLVSPSLVAYQLRAQVYDKNSEGNEASFKGSAKWRYSLYTAGLMEWRTDNFLYKVFWNPLKMTGNQLKFLSMVNSTLLTAGILIFTSLILMSGRELSPLSHMFIPNLIGALALAFALRAFSLRGNAIHAWVLVIYSHLCVAGAVSLNEHFTLWHVGLYLIGVLLAGVVGLLVLIRMKGEDGLRLSGFMGKQWKSPNTAAVFLICVLSMGGFPITTTFLGEDLLLSHVHETQFLLVFLVIVNYVVIGIAMIRMYSRLFMGPAKQMELSVARRMS